MHIAVAGIGYVGLSISMILSQNNKVIAHDILSKKIQMLKNGISPIEDKEIQKFLSLKKIRSNFEVTLDQKEAYTDAEYVVIATPTDFDNVTNFLDTTSLESVIKNVININPEATIIIKSTVPIGFTEKVKKKYSINNIIFCPEFIREGYALYDNLFPSRIVIGEESDRAIKFANLLRDSASDKNVEVLYTSSSEAESIKLFSNAYLAMRVSFFNELDSFAEMKNLNTKNIIKGMSFDKRIGMHYNNPSFGYGGYCLPKDTKQLIANLEKTPSPLIKAIDKSNEARKNFITDSIISRNPKSVGIFKLVMKSNSDNFRSSAIIDVIECLKNKGINVIIYEPILSDAGRKNFMDSKLVISLQELKDNSDIIIANRMFDELKDMQDIIYTRDLFKSDD